MSGTSPRCAKFQAKRARELAIRTSHWLVNSAPMPTAAPSIAPITGFGQATSGHQRLFSCASPRSPRRSPGTVCRSARSVPAQNEPPEPVTITTRAAGSAPARSTVSMNSPSIA